jgi:hypothetical protein
MYQVAFPLVHHSKELAASSLALTARVLPPGAVMVFPEYIPHHEH